MSAGDGTDKALAAALVRVPTEFTDSLQGLALDVLKNWLAAAGAPAEVYELMDECIVTEHYAKAVAKGNLGYLQNCGIEETVAAMLTKMAILGAVFEGGGTLSHRRENIPGFALPDDGLTIAERMTKADQEEFGKFYRGIRGKS